MDFNFDDEAQSILQGTVDMGHVKNSAAFRCANTGLKIEQSF
jgi:hypothetical protein